MQSTGLAPGTYFVRVRRAQGYGSYNVRAQLEAVTIAGDKEPNDTHEHAQVISLGQEFTGLLGYGNVEGTDTEDWYKFTTTKPGTIKVAVQAEETLKIYLNLYDVNGSRQLAADTGSPQASTRSVQSTGLAPGTYFVRIRRAQGYGSYNVRPQLEAVTIAGDKEPNDTHKQAQVIPLGQEFTGLLGIRKCRRYRH
ncbi:MAG: PPC domain-containing protein [Desulfovermiculus sp.]|nr:PPC domain-containing protein [Desulfovermiculus sp.]